MPQMQTVKDYCTHRLLIAGPKHELKKFERKAEITEIPVATDCSSVDCSPGRRIWQFVTESPALPAVQEMSRR